MATLSEPIAVAGTSTPETWFEGTQAAVGPADTGATTLTVVDPADFTEDGGTLTIGPGDVNAQVVDYTDVDDDTGVITLAEPLAATWAEGDRVELYPQALEKVAQVMVGDFDESVQVTVPHTLWDKVADGIRPDGEGEVVTFVLEGSEFVLADVIGSEPVIDGSYLDPTVPLPAEIVPAPAPVAPTVSPTPEVIGGIGVLFVRWAPIANATPVDVEVHLSETSPVTGDASTLAATVNGTQVSLRNLPDGNPLQYVDAGGNPVVYHVALRATNDAGDAPLSAEDSASMMQVTGPDVAAEYVYAGTFTFDQATGGTMGADMLVAGDIYAEGAAGERVSLSGSGFTVTGPTAAGNPIYVNFPTDGAKPNIFSGTVEANTLEVVAGATLRSQANMVAAQGRLNLSAGVQSPQSPPATEVTWPEVAVDTSTRRSGTLGNFALDPSACYGLAWAATQWLTAQVVPGSGTRIWAISTTGSTSVWADATAGEFEASGLTYIGTTLYVIGTYPGLGWTITTLSSAGTLAPSNTYSRVNTAKEPAMGTDGTNVLVAESVPASTEVRVRVYSPDNLDQIDETITTSGFDFPDTAEVGGIIRGTFDYGATRIVTTRRGGTDYDIKVANSAGAIQANENWPRGPISPRGFAWDGANFWALSAAGKLQRYTGLKWTTESDKWWVSYTWKDTNATGGTHETTQSPKSTFTMKKRAQLTATTNAIPTGAGSDDPNAVGIYVGRGAGTGSPLDLARTSMWLQYTGANTTLTTSAPTFSGTNPPTANDFPATSPGSLAAGLNGFSVDGNSNGSVGTGTFRDSVDARADARIAANVPGAWTTYTPTFTAPTTNPTLGNFTRAGRYVQVGKRVDFVIIITANASTGLGDGAYEFGLPVTARAADEVLGQGMQTSPNQPVVVRGVSATTASAYLTDTRAGLSATTGSVASGTVIRLSGTYEAA